MSEPVLFTQSSVLAPGIQVCGLDSYPTRIRDPRGSLWEKPFADAENFYCRMPMSSAVVDEYLNSQCPAWGASRPDLSVPTLLTLNYTSVIWPDDGWPEGLQRWTFPHDFETYGIMVPLVEWTTGAVRFKFALFQMFPYGNTTQAWKLLDGAKFKIDVTPTAGSVRKFLAKPDPSNSGRVIIPAGLYYLFILPDSNDFTGKYFARYPRDYSTLGTTDTSQIWRSDRYRLNTDLPPATWADYDYSTLVFNNDGTAPPIGTSSPASPVTGGQPWFRIDFGFYGRWLA